MKTHAMAWWTLLLATTGCTESVDLGASPDATGTGVPFHDALTVDSDAGASGESDTLPNTTPATTEDAVTDVGPEVFPTFDPVVTAFEGADVIPQTVLHLNAAVADGDSIASIEWSATQPIGSTSVFLPSSTTLTPSFEANVAGRYVFEARIKNARGAEAERSFEVFVNPSAAIHVELLWDTPNDIDQTDVGPEAGSDLDLHVAHPLAARDDGLGPDELDLDGDGREDPWFDTPFDCFWYNNNNPNWGLVDPGVDDNPSIDRDDTDGAGPENLNLAEPENDVCYQVGVHAWNDHAKGRSLVTVRVYVLSSLAFEQAGVELEHLDFWNVAKVCWVGGDAVVTPTKVCADSRLACDPIENPCAGGAECGLFITNDYVHPMFYNDG